MEKDKVPQDEGFLEGKTRDLCYALDENGKYTQVLSVGWEPKNAALEQALELIQEQVDEALKQLKEGNVSPVKYYMEKNMMDIKLLSQYIGIAKWRVRRHIKPSVFIALKDSVKQKYADVFNVPFTDFVNAKNLL
jgi:hypothetical protein